MPLSDRSCVSVLIMVVALEHVALGEQSGMWDVVGPPWAFASKQGRDWFVLSYRRMVQAREY